MPKKIVNVCSAVAYASFVCLVFFYNGRDDMMMDGSAYIPSS